jgi:hypothetical protein
MVRTHKNKQHSVKRTKKNHQKGRQLDYTRPGRLSYEGRSTRKELKRITKYGKKLDEMLRNHDDIPEWCQKKIILAGDYLGSVYHYMDFKIADHHSSK